MNMKKEILEAAHNCSGGECSIYCPLFGYVSCERVFREAIVDHHNKYRWHDLRKNPDDLPPSLYDEYIICEEWDDGELIYTTANSEYVWYHTNKKTLLYKVIAWREIEPYEPED